MFLEETTNSFIGNNTLFFQTFGIGISKHSSNNLIQANKIDKSFSAVSLYPGAVSNNLTNNHFFNNECGICIDGATTTYVTKNRISASVIGIGLRSTTRNFVFNNTISYSSYGDTVGFFLLNTTNNQLINNTIHDILSHGIFIERSSGTIFNENLVYENNFGVYLAEQANENTFSENIIKNNRNVAFFLQNKTTNNIFDHNNVINNNKFGESQAYDGNSNAKQKNTFNSNYWDEFVYPDENSDGITDHPYIISGAANNTDDSPRTTPTKENIHDISRPVLLFPNKQSTTLKKVVEIQWQQARDSYNHHVWYELSYSIDGGKTWIQLANALEIPAFTWNTKNVSDTESLAFKILAYDNYNESKKFESDITFSLKNSTAILPTFSFFGVSSALFFIVVLVLFKKRNYRHLQNKIKKTRKRSNQK